MFQRIAEMAPMPRGEPRDALTKFEGGLDIETPAWSVLAGALRDALNYEISIENGYQDIQGYERFDGRPAPSEQTFSILDVNITGTITVGMLVEGTNSGAQGRVIAIDVYPPGDEFEGTSYLVLGKRVGNFQGSEPIEVATVNVGNTLATAYSGSGPTPRLTAEYKNLVADLYRLDIQAVPGEGRVWGGFTLNGSKYAIRNAVGSTAANLYRASATGWTLIDLGIEIEFSGAGTYELQEGDTITGATSGATATVERVQIVSGTFGAGDAAGWLTLSNQVGTFQAENLDVGANLDVATIAGDSAAITLAPDGQLDWDTSNFADPRDLERAYGADGVNFGWEFDGTVFARIRTGMVNDTPDKCIVHKQHLFFAFEGSIQNSGIGDPRAWAVRLGANEIAAESFVTNFQVQPGSEGNAALLIACRQRMYTLYGNSNADWNLVRYRQEVGAYEWTLQQVTETVFLDDLGIMDLRTVQAFGNFKHSEFSNRIKRLIEASKRNAAASVVVRKKNQYRLFFNDNTAIYTTMQGTTLLGMMPVTLGHSVEIAWSRENAMGDEEVYFGSDDGFVYQMERGTSFDGDEIYAFMYSHFDNLGAIEYHKEFFAPVTLEGRSTGYAEFNLGYQLDYGSKQVNQPDDQTGELSGSEGATWDSGGSWDTNISWDDTSITPTINLELQGEGRNVSWIITKNSDFFDPVLFTGVHFKYLPTVQQRG